MAKDKGPGTFDSSPPAEEKAVSGPPSDKSLSRVEVRRVKPCPNCGTDLRPYKGAQEFKAGRMECDNCGRHFAS